MKTIVLVWTEEDFRVTKERRTDLGERPEIEVFQAPKACVWLNAGTDEDLEKAKAHADTLGWQVVTFPTTEPNPIGAAKKWMKKRAK